MTDDQLSKVLAKIAETEGREGYEGPKISGEVEAIQWMAEDFDDQEIDDDDGNVLSFPDDWIEDIIVGAIGRACYAEGWNVFFDLVPGENDRFEAEIFDEDFGELIRRSEDSLALAAASAYLDAIQEEMSDRRR